MAREEIYQQIGESIKRGYAWTIKEPKANVIIVTGMAETAIRYDDFANFLNEHGYDVYCLDHYGQGLTAGNTENLGVVPSSFFSRSFTDIENFLFRLLASLKSSFIFAH